MSEFTEIGSLNDLRELLALGLANITIRVNESRTGRAAFDSAYTAALYVQCARDSGYEVAAVRSGGDPPYHGWMGPGSRWFEISVNAPPRAAAPVSTTMSSPEDASELVQRYRAWIGEGDFAACFGDWIRRQRASELPREGDVDDLFWMYALAAYAGLRDGRADPHHIAIAAGTAESHMNYSNSEQVAFDDEIKRLYGI